MMHVRTLLGEGVHCCWMVVDDDTAMVYGRDLMGYPRKMAQISYEEVGDHVSASVIRRGAQVMSIEADRGIIQYAPPAVHDQKIYNIGGLAQIFAANPVWMLRPAEQIHESHEANASLTLYESEYDPIAEFVTGDPLNGRMVNLDITSVKYIFPISMAGPLWFARTYDMRVR